MSVFTKEYLDRLLDEKQIKLPDDFYHYLTQISSNQLIFYDYESNETIKLPKFYDDCIHKFSINIEDLPSSSQQRVSIPINVTKLSYYFPEMKYSENDNECSVQNNISINTVTKWMLHIAFGNTCIYPYYIYLGDGPHFGSIWINYDNSLYLEYPDFTKIFSSFEAFLKSVNEYKNSDRGDDSDYDSGCDCEEVLLCE